jgi:hypothetical protein
MRTKFFKGAGFVAALVIPGSAYFAGLRAQQSTPAPTRPSASTNWIGCLVAGQTDPTDAIAIGGPHPTVTRNVEIGLRSDGVVVWRRTSAGK